MGSRKPHDRSEDVSILCVGGVTMASSPRWDTGIDRSLDPDTREAERGSGPRLDDTRPEFDADRPVWRGGDLDGISRTDSPTRRGMSPSRRTDERTLMRSVGPTAMATDAWSGA
jgi:hypothetical protein